MRILGVTLTNPAAVTAAVLSVFVANTVAGPLEDLQPGEWYEVPSSRMDAAAPAVIPPGNTGIPSVMNAWCGGAYDTRRERLLVWGGGHQDYSGNEIYAFDMNTLKWSRVSEPSTDVGGNESSGVYPDGNPRARHTYNSIQYLASIDRFCAFGSGGLYPSGQTGSARTECFDFQAKHWSALADAKNYGIAAFSAVDPVAGAVWAGKGILTRFDPVANVWGRATEYDNDIEWTNYLTMDIDPKRRLMIAVGAGKVYRWNIANPAASISAESLSTAGGASVIGVGAPGLAYDPVGERMAAWGGGPDVYTLDPDSRVWTRHARTGGAVPPTPQANGTYGRFRYAPTKNVFVLANATDQNVFVFRLTAGNGTPEGIIPARKPLRKGSRDGLPIQRVVFRSHGVRDSQGRADVTGAP